MRSSRLFWWSFCLQNGSILMTWGCFSIVSNVMQYNYCCRRHTCTMHANKVFAADSILPPHHKADVYLCAVFNLEDIAFKRFVASWHQIYAFPMLNIKYWRMFVMSFLSSHHLISKKNLTFWDMAMLLKPNVPSLWQWPLTCQGQIVLANWLWPHMCQGPWSWSLPMWWMGRFSDSKWNVLQILTFAYHQNYYKYKQKTVVNQSLIWQRLPLQNGISHIKISSKDRSKNWFSPFSSV